MEEPLPSKQVVVGSSPISRSTKLPGEPACEYVGEPLQAIDSITPEEYLRHCHPELAPTTHLSHMY